MRRKPNQSKQLDFAIPASTIGSLSSGEFCGIVADNPDPKIRLKKFHGEIVMKKPFSSVAKKNSDDLPKFVGESSMSERYLEIKKEAQLLVQKELERMINTPELAGLIVKRT